MRSTVAIPAFIDRDCRSSGGVSEGKVLQVGKEHKETAEWGQRTKSQLKSGLGSQSD
jgi:hypothetical protein